MDDASDVILSTQDTTVPLRATLALLISNLDIRGKLFGGEVLENVNVIELMIVVEDRSLRVVDSSNRETSLVVLAFSGVKLNLHSIISPGMLHVSSTCPSMQT